MGGVMLRINTQHDYRPSYEQIRGLIDLILDAPLWAREHPMIEIGSNTGDSTQIFSLFFKNLYNVDCYEDDRFQKRTGAEVFELFTKKVGYRGIKTIICTSDELFYNSSKRACLPEYAGFIYIDANHAYPFVKRDILNCWPLVCEDGIISGHDYGLQVEGADGVEKAVCEIFGEPDKVYCDGSWSVQKVKGRKFNPSRS
jgi:hypothetical protein